MKIHVIAVAAGLMAMGLAGCGDSTGPSTGTLPSAVVGTWVANSTCSPACSFIITSVANPDAHTDLVATSGFTVDLRLHDDGTASLNLFGETLLGTARIDGSTLILASGGSADTIDYTAAANTLDLQFRSTFNVDINSDGVADPVRAHAVLVKQ